MAAELVGDGFETGIVTRDGERLAAFYCGVLGFEELDPVVVPGHCTIRRLRCGRTVLRLVIPEVAPVHDHAGGEFMAATGYRYLLLQITDVRATVEEVRAAGCAVPVPPFELRPGRIVSQVQDPDGNHIELVQQA